MYDTTKVIDLSQTNLIKKRNRTELESDDTNLKNGKKCKDKEDYLEKDKEEKK